MPKQEGVVITKWPKAQKNALCGRNGNWLYHGTSFKNISLTFASYWFYYLLPFAVNKPQPLSPCQRTKYTSHDEASPAPAVWTSKLAAQICLWNQEKPSKRLSFTFRYAPQACQGAWSSRSVPGLTFWPALGSTGRTRTNELVSQLFKDSCFTIIHFLILFSLFFFYKWTSGVGGSDRSNWTSWAEAGSAKRTGKAGHQDGGEGSSNHKASQTPAHSM